MEPCTWEKALEYCEQLEYAGHSDWRLPSIEELLTLIDRAQANPALPERHPFGDDRESYWSSTTGAEDPDGAWIVYIGYGCVSYGNKAYSHYVWPVRGGQFDSLGNLMIPGVPSGCARFKDNGDNTVTDNRTGLVWIKDMSAV